MSSVMNSGKAEERGGLILLVSVLVISVHYSVHRGGSLPGQPEGGHYQGSQRGAIYSYRVMLTEPDGDQHLRLLLLIRGKLIMNWTLAMISRGGHLIIFTTCQYYARESVQSAGNFP